MTVARRLPSRPLHAAMRCALTLLRLWQAGLAAGVCVLAAGVTWAEGHVRAEFAEPTTRYDHGVLGDDVEWGALVLRGCQGCGADIIIRLPETRVFEDITPRLFVDRHGSVLVAVVESDAQLGARLSIYGRDGLFAAGPFIGQRNRWLAPVGVEDLDGDGHIEIAYVDRPHLAKVLRVFRLAGDGETGTLTEVAQAAGLTNHKIGWDYIGGGLRDCGKGPEMIVASADWSEVLSVRFDGTTLQPNPLGRYRGNASFLAALACETLR